MSARPTSSLTHPASVARIAGALWLVSVGAGIYAELFVRGSLIVHGDAVATATRIIAGESLFRVGFVADLIGDMTYLGVTLLLYAILVPVGRTMSLIMVGFGVAGSAVMAANLVNLFAPIILLRTAGLSADTALVLALLRMHSLGYNISIALFSVQVAAMGYLIFRSTFFPRVFGVLFLIEAVCNTISTFGGFLDLAWVDRLGAYILIPGLPAEGGFGLWLLVFGLNVKRWVALCDGHQ